MKRKKNKKWYLSCFIRLLSLCLLIGCTLLFCTTDASAKKITAAKTRQKAGNIKINTYYTVTVKGLKGGMTFVAPHDGTYSFYVGNLRSKGVKKSKDYKANMNFYLVSRNNLDNTKKSKNGSEYYTPFKKVRYFGTNKKNTYIYIGTEAAFDRDYLEDDDATDDDATSYYAYGDIKLKKGDSFIVVAEGYGVNKKKGFTFNLEVQD